MAGLAFVHGINDVGRFNGNITTDYFDYTQMTAGEFKTHLQAAQLRTMYQADPDQDSENVKLLKSGENLFFNSIYKGLHGTKGGCLPCGLVDDRLLPVIEAIQRNQSRFLPATKSGMFLNKRSSVSTGVNPLDQLEPSTGINGYPFRDGCYTKMCNTNDNPCTSSTVVSVDAECQRIERVKEVFNQYLETASHHILYNFATDNQAGAMRPTSSWKVGQHIQAIQEFARVSYVDSDNINTWVELGVLRQNAKRNLGVLTPEQTVQLLLENPDIDFDNVDQVARELGINFLPAAVYIIWACVAALVAATGLVQVLKGQEPTAFDRIAGIGKAMFSPTGVDFTRTTTTGGGTGTTGTTCPTGYKWDMALSKCVPITTTGGGTTPAKTTNTSLVIGGGLLAALLLFGNKK